MAGRKLSEAEINELWEAWTPSEVAQRMSGVAAQWYVAAGWALELFTADAAREHDDLEIAVPAALFGDIVTAFPGFEWVRRGRWPSLALPRPVGKPLSDMATRTCDWTLPRRCIS